MNLTEEEIVKALEDAADKKEAAELARKRCELISSMEIPSLENIRSYPNGSDIIADTEDVDAFLEWAIANAETRDLPKSFRGDLFESCAVRGDANYSNVTMLSVQVKGLMLRVWAKQKLWYKFNTNFRCGGRGTIGKNIVSNWGITQKQSIKADYVISYASGDNKTPGSVGMFWKGV